MPDEMTTAFEAMLEAFVAVCREFFGDNLHGIILYGAHKDAFVHTQSDVDLLVVCNELPPSSWDRYDVVMQLLERAETLQEVMRKESGIPIYISPVLRTLEEMKGLAPVWRREIRTGRILYDRERRVQNLMKEMSARSEPEPGSSG